MKKFYKRVNAKRLTIESMANCVTMCHVNCVHCGNACGGNAANGAALVGTPAIWGNVDEQLVATGSIFG